MKSQNLGLWMMLAASVALSACSKKKDGDNVTRVKGDPYAFVKHATMNGSPLLPATLFADQDSWVIGATAIIEGPATKTYAEVKEEQAPGHESDDAEGLVTAAKSLNPDGTISIVGGALKLVLVPETQGLRVAGLVIGGENIIGKPTIQVLHISHNVERGAVSILVYDSQRGERALAAFYLLKGPVAVLKMSWVDRAYEYIFGAGKKVRWNGDKPVEITKCTTAPESMMRLMDQAISPWMGVIGKRLSTASAADANCPPFTDLNTHTITYVDDWIELAGPAGVLGWTRPIRDVRNDEFLDSDVVILLDSITRLGRAYN
ncbi:MAG TPA: hypothetical protein PKC28_15275, partial [Bdellovibrionales bacterium]|nr:hypothetical protein [Bdellovibrionales bacterium]